MFETLLRTLEVGLSMWRDEKKRKYLDRFIELKTAYRREFNKPDAARSDAVLDDLRDELCILADAFSAAARGQDPADK